MKLARAFLSLSLLQAPKASSSFAFQYHFQAPSRTAASSSFMTRNINRTDMYSTSTDTRSDGKVTIFGGDYAGHSATFSSIDGGLIRVPDHFVPDAMVEWGQVPNGLECIVSEDLVEADNDENDTKQMWERNVVTIMPEVGCGLDNLDTMNNQQFIPNTITRNFHVSDVKVGVATGFLTDAKRRVECIFVLEEDSNGSKDDDNDKTSTSTTRYRISINLHENNQLRSPIDMTKERKTSEESSKGKIANGGGLDSRTVSRLIGKEDFNNPFCNGKGYDVSSLEGTWTIDKDGSDEEVERGSDFWNNDDVSTFSLPGNILVRSCKSSYMLEISLLLTGGSETSTMKRIALTRNLKDGVDGDVEYSVETKKR